MCFCSCCERTALFSSHIVDSWRYRSRNFLCALLVRVSSSVDMVSVSRVVFFGVAGHALGQSAWQASELIEVNINYDVRSIGVADCTALMHRSRALQAKLSAAAPASLREPSNGYSTIG